MTVSRKTYTITGTPFSDGDVVITKGTYGPPDFAIALQAFGADTWEPWATFSVNLPGLVIPENHTWIKTWSENEGTLEWLIEAGVVSPTTTVQQCGPHGARAVLCEVLI